MLKLLVLLVFIKLEKQKYANSYIEVSEDCGDDVSAVVPDRCARPSLTERVVDTKLIVIEGRGWGTTPQPRQVLPERGV